MDRFEGEWFDQKLREHAEEGRDVQLFEIQGQTVFPLYSSILGTPLTDCAVFPILRGSGEKAPPYKGAFPFTDRETIQIGNGWVGMCVIFPYHETKHEWIARLEEAEEKLRALKSGSSGG